MKISPEGTDDRLGIAEEKISKSEDSNRKYAKWISGRIMTQVIEYIENQ